MKKSTMLWIVSALAYVGVVITGYYVLGGDQSQAVEHSSYTENGHNGDQAEGEHELEQSVDGDEQMQAEHQQSEHDEQSDSHGQDGQNAQHGQAEHHEHGDHQAEGTGMQNEVTPDISYANGELAIELKADNGSVPQLEINHEKYMHLIVVSADLQQYKHLHPEKKAEGSYVQSIELADGAYKVFVDIKPKDLRYAVQPLNLQIGTASDQQQANKLVADSEFSRTVDGKTIELKQQAFEAGQDITLEFDTQGVVPQPYLGALGHVVILDEQGERFIHVHPASEDKTSFATQFSQAGMYKLWAEFKFDDVVHVYPFVIEVK